MKLYSKIHKCNVETIGITTGQEILCVTDDGRWIHGNTTNLVPITKGNPDMSITVGHVIDNPTFDKEFAFKIGYWSDEACDWIALYDSREEDDAEIPAELLIEKVTYLTIVDGQLVLEVNR